MFRTSAIRTSAIRTSDARIERLAKVPGLEHANRHQLTTLARLTDEVAVAPGASVVSQWERPSWAVVVVEGTFTAVRDDRPVGLLGPGDGVGQRAAQARGGASHTVTSLDGGRVLLISGPALYELAAQLPRLAVDSPLAAVPARATLVEATPVERPVSAVS